MTERTFTLRTLHGNTDYADAKARTTASFEIDYAERLAREAGLADQPTPDPPEPRCDVIAVFVDPANADDRVELHFGDWNRVGALAVGLQITFTLPDAPDVDALQPA